jgi:hypothetical protein
MYDDTPGGVAGCQLYTYPIPKIRIWGSLFIGGVDGSDELDEFRKEREQQ